MNKVFSTLFVHDKHIPFLQNLKNAINTMKEGALLIFNDVNSWYMGRDVFDGTISHYLNNVRRYYTGNPPFSGNGNWLQIPQMNVIYPFTNYGNIFPLYTIAQSVFFEYRK
jgi:hypothetical protein